MQKGALKEKRQYQQNVKIIFKIRQSSCVTTRGVPPALPSRIDRYIDNIVQFLSKHWVVAIHFDHLEKLTPYCKGFKQIR